MKLLETTRRKSSAYGSRFLSPTPPKSVRLAAIRAVGQVGVPSATSLLRNAVNDQDISNSGCGFVFTDSVGRIRYLDVESASALNATDERLRARRIRLLGLAAEPASDEFLTKVLSSKEPAVPPELSTSFAAENKK